VTDSNVFPLSQPGTLSDPLTEVLRSGGIWPDRDIAAGCCGIETICASLPTQSPSQPRTPARKAGVPDLRKRMRARDLPHHGLDPLVKVRLF
jgi:hypothetical protein